MLEEVATWQPSPRAGFRVLSRTPAVLALAVLLVSAGVLLTVALVQTRRTRPQPPGLKYGVVLDAGSSRTTVYVYHWPAEKENDTGVVSQSLKCSVPGSGISSYDKNPEDAPRAFESCMGKVWEVIPAPLHASTHLYLGATAGMRLLRLQNATAAAAVLASVRGYLEAQPFNFGGARILTGQEEGECAWITANYLKGNFVQRTPWPAWTHPQGARTVGALDLGGASTQIAFVPAERGWQEAGARVSLFGYSYALHTRSLLCFGRQEAERRLLAALLQDAPSAHKLVNPCYPQGYSAAFTLGQIFGSSCMERQRPARLDPLRQVLFIGSGSPSHCGDRVGALFHPQLCPGPGPCPFDDADQPEPHGPFVAFAGFYYTANALNLSGSFSLDAFNTSTWDFCSRAWTELPALLPKFQEEYARSYCFSAHYIYHLLVHGFKFTASTWPQIHFEKQVGNSSLGWALGYMLNLTNQIPAEHARAPRLPVPAPIFVGVLATFATAAVLALAVLLYLCAGPRITHAPEQALDTE
ncbi:ectonucleoside triphosphate diphosphohydrolase 3 isoform X1 [Dipodomys merriami]|uniref:ectonucleoside triphosphate diphosphohydrolase 3 isoform X1 n=1 Tax=Dipodomys merriami TaxID=94247 RepID=UPI00384C4774